MFYVSFFKTSEFNSCTGAQKHYIPQSILGNSKKPSSYYNWSWYIWFPSRVVIIEVNKLYIDLFREGEPSSCWARHCSVHRVWYSINPWIPATCAASVQVGLQTWSGFPSCAGVQQLCLHASQLYMFYRNSVQTTYLQLCATYYTCFLIVACRVHLPYNLSHFAALPRSRGSTLRTPLHPEGNGAYPSVAAGNQIACRTLVLLYICAALHVWWILEQPVNSLMQELPAFKYFMRQVRTYRHSMCMKEYGGPTQKPTWLYSGSWDGIYNTFGIFVLHHVVFICFYVSEKQFGWLALFNWLVHLFFLTWPTV